MNTTPAPAGPFNSWEPKEFGIPRATAVAIALVVLISGFCYWATIVLAPKPPIQAIQVTQAQLVSLPAPTPPPPPPKVIPPPKPLPAIIPKPLPVPSRIVVATKPPPPVRHIYKPVAHPVVTHQPAPPMPVAHPAPPQSAPVSHAAPAQPAGPPTSGIPIYGSEMHNILEQNQNVPAALAELGVSGTALVEITVAPDGHVISVKLIRSGGNSLIDQTALDHALHATFPPFSSDMPSSSLSFVVPVDIEPQSND